MSKQVVSTGNGVLAMQSALALFLVRALKPKQPLLAIEPAGISVKRAVGGNHAMARHDNRNGITRDRGPHGTGRHNGCFVSRYTMSSRNTLGDLTIRSDLATRDRKQLKPNLALKRRTNHMQRRRKPRLLPRKISIQPSPRTLKHRRSRAICRTHRRHPTGTRNRIGTYDILRILFEQLQDIRRDVRIPLILMGYLNPIMHFGFEAFCRKCTECGIDGVIIPDLPFREYEENYKAVAQKYDIRVIMLITPETSEKRIREIDAHTDGFIYMVSSAATTGAQKDFDARKQVYFKKIQDMNLRNPRMVGFGISNRQTFDTACSHASGAIIGSRFVTLLDEYKGNAQKAISHLKEDLGKSGKAVGQ